MPPTEHNSPFAEAPDPSGHSIGRFQLLKKLGQGGMGTVYLARDPELERSIAIKLITAGNDQTEEQLVRFEREAQALAKLSHPGIVAVHEVGHHQHQPFLVMDFVEGQTFAEMLRQEDVPLRRTVEVGRDVALALDHAHAEGIIHRDIKSDNILVAPDSRALLTDFGLAHDEAAEEQLTRTGVIIGTPHFLAPEQISKPRGEIGPWTDVYSLGATLHDSLVGSPPFQSTNIVGLMHQILRQAAPPLHRIDSSIPRNLSAIVLKCLEKHPEQRYSSAAALADDLQRFLDGEPVLAQGHRLASLPIHWITRHPSLSATLLAVVLIGTYSIRTIQKSDHKGTGEERIRAVVEQEQQNQRAISDQKKSFSTAQDGETAQRQAEQTAAELEELNRAQFFNRLVNQALLRNFATQPEKDRQKVRLVKLTPDTTTQELAYVSELEQVTYLDFAGAPVSESGISHIVKLKRLNHVNLKNTGITDAMLAHLPKLQQLRYLHLAENPLTDAALEHLEAMTRLHYLNLENTQVGDQGLSHLENLVNLKTLHLNHTQVSDSGLQFLQGMHRLQQLHLANTSVSNGGLKDLKSLPALQKLVLEKTMVDDTGVELLKTFRQLRYLSLTDTQVTEEAVQELRRELPFCTVLFR